MLPHISAQFTEHFTPMLDYYGFYEEHLGLLRESVLQLVTQEEMVSDAYAFKGKMQKNKRPSRFNFPLRGGKINTVCEEHRFDPIHCCTNKNLQGAPMLMCDYCLCWVHAKCEEMSNGLLNEVESYRCTYCTQWESKYEQHFKPLLKRGHSDAIMLPKKHPNFGAIEHW